MLSDSKFCVIQNGIFSQFFNIGRGCRQGDPISPYLFIMYVEIMPGILFRRKSEIKGIFIANKEYKLFQYGDDTGIILDGIESSLRHSLNLLDQFSKFSGLLPNLEKKTQCIWIGSLKGSKNRLCMDKNLEWTNSPFSVLVHISGNNRTQL